MKSEEEDHVLDTAPWPHPFVELPRNYALFRPCVHASVLSPSWITTCGFSVSIVIAGSHVPLIRLMASSGHLSCRMPLRP